MVVRDAASAIDLNLLPALDALLSTQSVTAAALRLGLSASAMSRTLSRLRAATGDPLLVRAGRRMVPTPHAAALRDRAHALSRDAHELLSPRPAPLDLSALDAGFTLRGSESFMEQLAAPVFSALLGAAPRLRLRFALRPDRDPLPLREGDVDLEIGRHPPEAPEPRARMLFRDGFAVIVRVGHPVLDDGAPLTVERLLAFPHAAAGRDAVPSDPIDAALEPLGRLRRVVAIVPGYPDAVRLVRRTDLLAVVPRSCVPAGGEAASGLVRLSPPLALPEFPVSLFWHPRRDADPVHRWLRDAVTTACRAVVAAT